MDLEGVRAYSPTRITDEQYEAAVLVPIIYRDGVPHLLFTKRADHLGEHPGQMSFPGGSHEPRDDSLYETALREAHEEIGLDPSTVTRIGQLDDIRTVTQYSVTPFVARIPDRTYSPAEGEVAEIAILSLGDLLTAENYEAEFRDHPYYGEITVHYFRVGGYTVWGATGRILVQLLELTTDWRAPQPPHSVVDHDSE